MSRTKNCLPAKDAKLFSRVPISSLVADPNPAFKEIRIERTANNRFTLQILPSPLLPPGYFAANITLRGTDAANDVPFTVRLPVSGTVIGDVRVTPKSIRFCPARVGDRLEEVVVLQSALGGRIEIMPLGPLPAGAAVSKTVRRAENVVSFSVTQTITSPGSQYGRIVFKVWGSGVVHPLEVSLPVEWHGLY